MRLLLHQRVERLSRGNSSASALRRCKKSASDDGASSRKRVLQPIKRGLARVATALRPCGKARQRELWDVQSMRRDRSWLASGASQPDVTVKNDHVWKRNRPIWTSSAPPARGLDLPALDAHRAAVASREREDRSGRRYEASAQRQRQCGGTGRLEPVRAARSAGVARIAVNRVAGPKAPPLRRDRHQRGSLRAFAQAANR